MESTTPEKTIKSPARLIVWAIAAALVIVVNLLFHYAIVTVYPEPKYENFCPMSNQQFNDAETCVGAGGQWTNNQYSPQEVTMAVKGGNPLGWCDPNFTCNKAYNDYQSVYNRNVFIVLIVLSLATLIAGVFIGIEVLSLGFSWAGVVSLIVATAQYWSDANNWMRLVILVLALGALVWIGIKRFNK